jgi:hypothetical protein
MVHIRTVETRPLITSTETRCVMGAATEAEAMEAGAMQAEAMQAEAMEAEAMEAGAMQAEAMEAEAIARKSDKLKANGCCVADPSAVARCWGDVPAL